MHRRRSGEGRAHHAVEVIDVHRQDVGELVVFGLGLHALCAATHGTTSNTGAGAAESRAEMTTPVAPAIATLASASGLSMLCL